MNLRQHKRRATTGWSTRRADTPEYRGFDVYLCWSVRRDAAGRRNWIMGSLVRPAGWHPVRGWAKPATPEVCLGALVRQAINPLVPS